jgi:hypothetical protein
MGVLDGQAVSAEVTNPAFINKNIDDTTPSGLGLASGVTARGSAVTDVQTEHNALWSFLGGLINQTKAYLPAWVSQNFGAANASIKAKIEAIDSAFTPASGSQTYRAGNVSVSMGAASASVTFSPPWMNTNFVPLLGFTNTVDASPIFLQGMVSAKTVNGFTVTLNAATDSANYVLNYEVRVAL